MRARASVHVRAYVCMFACACVRVRACAYTLMVLFTFTPEAPERKIFGGLQRSHICRTRGLENNFHDHHAEGGADLPTLITDHAMCPQLAYLLLNVINLAEREVCLK